MTSEHDDLQVGVPRAGEESDGGAVGQRYVQLGDQDVRQWVCGQDREGTGAVAHDLHTEPVLLQQGREALTRSEVSVDE